jgi:hypothetical protein
MESQETVPAEPKVLASGKNFWREHPTRCPGGVCDPFGFCQTRGSDEVGDRFGGGKQSQKDTS